MNNDKTNSKELRIPDFDAFEKAIEERLPQLRQLSPDVVEGTRRVAQFVHSLRVKRDLTRWGLVDKTGLPWLWIALLEEEMLLPSELSESNLRKLGQALPPIRGVESTPGEAFLIIAQDLLLPDKPSGGQEEGSFPFELALAASEEDSIVTEADLEETTSPNLVGRFETQGDTYDILATSEGSDVFLRPACQRAVSYLALDETLYPLKQVEGDSECLYVVGLGAGEIRLFLAIYRREPTQHRIEFRD